MVEIFLNHQNDFGRPALRHRSLNSFFQGALYLPSYNQVGGDGGDLPRQRLVPIPLPQVPTPRRRKSNPQTFNPKSETLGEDSA